MKLHTQLSLLKIFDLIIGIPLCFFLSLLRGPCELLLGRKKEEAVKKILLIKLTELGAIILARPLMDELKRRFPDAEIHFLTFERNRDVFSLLKDVVSSEHVLTIRDQTVFGFLGDVARVWGALRQKHFDLVIDLEFFSRLTAALSFVTAAPKRLGFDRYTFEGLYRGNLLTHKLSYNPHLHVSKIYLSFAQMLRYPHKHSPELDDAIDDQQIKFPQWVSSLELKSTMRARLKSRGVDESRRVILLNPGEGAIGLREWPLEHFEWVAQKVLEDSRNCIVLIGEKSSVGKDVVLMERLNSRRCVNLTGQTTIPELMALFEIAQALLINDCGLGHLAALTPIESLILFGPESPRVFSPVTGTQYIFYSNFPCSPCLSILNHRRSLCRDNRCLKAIAPQEVFARLSQLLHPSLGG